MAAEYVLTQAYGAPWIGPAARAAVFTSVGVTLIVYGVLRRRERARWDREDDSRLLRPDTSARSDEDRVAAPRSRGTGFIAAGTVLLLLGILHILNLIAILHESGLL